MVDFLLLTAESEEDPVRDKLIKEYVLPFLPPMRSRLQELETPYLHLLDALEKVMDVELRTQPMSEPQEKTVESHVG
jgi:nitrate reductase assembly molybdenum cofactor insertion protein NarJ